MARARKTWSVAEAKARLSEVIESARVQGPQIVTRKGKKVVAIVAFETWQQGKTRKGTLFDFFRNSPLRGSGIQLERDKSPPRDPGL